MSFHRVGMSFPRNSMGSLEFSTGRYGMSAMRPRAFVGQQQAEARDRAGSFFVTRSPSLIWEERAYRLFLRPAILMMNGINGTKNAERGHPYAPQDRGHDPLDDG